MATTRNTGGSISPSPPSLSGRHWTSRFPGSVSLRDLRFPFRRSAEAFVGALRAAGATVVISSTLRDPKRAYLMHWAWRIVRQNFDPQTVPALDGVDIIWSHTGAGGYSRATSVAAAREMVNAFQIQRLGVAPALLSRHTLGCAIDMTISWRGSLLIPDAVGNTVEIDSAPRTGLNAQLRRVAQGYGVIKYNRAGRDDPHWSDNGA